MTNVVLLTFLIRFTILTFAVKVLSVLDSYNLLTVFVCQLFFLCPLILLHICLIMYVLTLTTVLLFMCTSHILSIIRPPYILVGWFRFYRDSFFLPSFYRHLPSEFAVRNSTKISHVLGSKCDLKMRVPKSGDYPPLQIGGTKNSVFSTTSQRNGNFNGLYLRNKTQYTKWGKCVYNYMGLLHR